MKRLFLTIMFTLAMALPAMAQDKIYGYTYHCSKGVDEVLNTFTDSYIRPEHEGAERYFVYHEQLNCFVPSTKEGEPLMQYYLAYDHEQKCYVGINPLYAPHGEFISLNFEVFTILDHDATDSRVYDMYFLTSITHKDKR